MARERQPKGQDIRDIVTVSQSREQVLLDYGQKRLPISRDGFNLCLGTLRGSLPERYGRFLAQEVSRAIDESGNLDVTKLSPVVVNLAAAFAEFSTYMVSKDKDSS